MQHSIGDPFHWHCRWQIANRAAYSEVRDHSKHRLRRAIRRLERDSVLLHSNQLTSTSVERWRRRRANQLHIQKSPWWHPRPSFRTPFRFPSTRLSSPATPQRHRARSRSSPAALFYPPRGLANGPSAVLSDRFASLRAGGRETSTWNERKIRGNRKRTLFPLSLHLFSRFSSLRTCSTVFTYPTECFITRVWCEYWSRRPGGCEKMA